MTVGCGPKRPRVPYIALWRAELTPRFNSDLYGHLVLRVRRTYLPRLNVRVDTFPTDEHHISALTPQFGEYMAGKYVDLGRLLAAAYAGRSQEVTVGWQQLGRQFCPMVDLEVGRAYLESGAMPEAEQDIRWALMAHGFQAFTHPAIVAPDFLTYFLGQFYLGKVLEQTGKRTEALRAYQNFLGHFENSTARLPQIAEARAAVKRLK